MPVLVSMSRMTERLSKAPGETLPCYTKTDKSEPLITGFLSFRAQPTRTLRKPTHASSHLGSFRPVSSLAKCVNALLRFFESLPFTA